MSNYTKSTNFATKDNLTPGDPLKIVRGTEIDTEFNNIATAIATKTDNASAAITGGTINDTTIGATTASTGAFTTLAASGNVTLSGGTANGVAYLNGSKVVTSGSALWFDGTNFGVGTGGNTLNQQSVVYKAGANAIYQQVANGSTGLGATNGIRVGLTSAGVGEWYSPTAAISYIDNTEQMRLTSTGLGIGTSSPAFKLDVKGGTGNTGFARISTVDATNGGAGLILQGATSGQKNWVIAAQYNVNGGLEFTQTTANGGSTIGSTPAMTLDASGNLLVGGTSNAASNRAFFYGNGGTSIRVCDGTNTNFRGYVIGSLNTDATEYAYLKLNANSGELRLYVGPNTYGGFQTFYVSGSEAARIDSSGNLLVGATSIGSYISGILIGNSTSAKAVSLAVNGSGASFNGVDTVNNPTAGFTMGHVTSTAKLQMRVGSSGGVEMAAGATAWSSLSDERLKDIIEPIENAITKVSSLRSVIGKYKTDADGTRRSFLVAQDVYAVLPEAVSTTKISLEDETSYLTVAYTDTIPLLVAAFNEQQAIITAQQAALESLTTRLTALESK